MKILVISGFLGSGKTTFIKEFIKKTKRDYCILENEYGAINIDKDYLKENSDPLKIYEMTEGCICCSSKGEFASSILSISNTIDPDYLIIEPTGVGYLSSIINNLNKIRYEKIEILKPVTIVDGKYLLNHYNDISEVLIDQITNSDTILVSKLENSDLEDKKKVEDKIKSINENACVYTKHYSTFSPSFFFNLLKSENDKKIEDKKMNIKKLEEFSLSSFTLNSSSDLVSILDDITRGFYGSIIRSKGFVKFSNYTLQFDLVDNLYAVTKSETEEESKVIFIGEKIDKISLRKRFNLLTK